MEQDEIYMRLALEQAVLAAQIGEVPIGAVIVQDDRVIGCGYNLRESKKNALCHAEILAIDDACKTLGGWRLPRCTLYVTLEPCPMCTGAIINSRIERVVYGAPDSKAGCFGSVLTLTEFSFNHKPVFRSSVLRKECGELLTDFFQNLRNSRK